MNGPSGGSGPNGGGGVQRVAGGGEVGSENEYNSCINQYLGSGVGSAVRVLCGASGALCAYGLLVPPINGAACGYELATCGYSIGLQYYCAHKLTPSPPLTDEPPAERLPGANQPDMPNP